MGTRTSLVLALLGLAGAAGAAGQQRPISGRVTNAVTNEPVAGARVSVVGSPITAVSGGDGTFSLSAPQGAVTLVARLIGYKRRQVVVGAEQATVSVSLEPDVFNLDAVVVTGQATAVEQRNLANAVTTVTPEVLNRAPTPTVETALYGKIPGALIQSNSGAPGGGMQINLRGVSTINGPVDPLIVVDGVVISNAAIPNGANAVTAAQAGGNPRSQDAPVNRIADLNPDDIERIEVLKGASAAAIYGSKATNGVIMVTTRRGRVGPPRFHLTQRFGTYDLANKIEARRFADVTEATGAFGSGAAAFCTPTCQFFDHEEALYGRNALSTETSASLMGGSEQTTYYVSALVKNDEGTAIGTGYQKQSFRVNLDQQVADRLSLRIGTQLIHSLSQRGLSNNDNTGTSPYMTFPFTPSFVNLAQPGARNPFSPSNPIETFRKIANDEDVWRGLGTFSATWNAVTTERHRVRVIGLAAADYFQQRNDLYSPPELQYEPQDGFPGTVVLRKSENRNLNLAGNLVHTYSPGGGWSATTSAGVQWEERRLNFFGEDGRGLPAGQRNVDLAASQNSAQAIEHARDLGVYAQEEVLALEERLLLTLGVRADRSSNNGDPDKFFLYPKAAASYRFLAPAGGVDELKLRAAWGQTGNQPLFGFKYVADTTGAIDGRVGTYVGQRLGDPSIEPERQTEIEAGVDAAFAGGRATASVTVYRKTITDLLLERTLAPSSGFETKVFNGGKLRNTGIEIAGGVTPIQTADMSLVLRATFFRNRSKIVELPVPTFQTLGFGTNLGVFQIEQDSSATQIFGLEGKVGDATPDFLMSFSGDLTWGAWSLGALLDWKKGGDIINLTELLYDAGANSNDYVSAGADRITRWAVGGETKVYVQDGSYIKLRELTLSYTVPQEVASKLFGAGIRNARLSLSGRNLIRITDYRGLDPEVSNFGNQPIGRNIDVAPFPPWRSFFFSIDLDF